MDSDERREFAISIQTEAHCDVAVVGGGIAGVFAALAAARAGAATVLVEQHGFVGGQGTAGGVHTFCGETRLVNDAWREMLARLDAFGAIAPYRPNADGRAFSGEYLKFVLQEMLAEAGVRVLLHTHFVELDRAGAQVAALVLFNKSGCFRLSCRQAIDASGDADLVARGGWGYDKGGPALLPGGRGIDRSAGAKQLPMSQYFSMLNVRKPVRAHLPPGCPEWEGDEQVPMTSISGDENAIVIKMKVIGHDATDGFSLAEAEQAARRQMMGLVYHLQTKGYHGKRYETFRLLAAAPHIGVREGRRARTQYPLRAEDVLQGRRFTDAVAVGSYHIDYHWPTVVQRAGTGITSQCPPYQIPLRALRPDGSENLLVPGRCMGGEQMAMSSFRVMGTCAQTGFAAGTAAALAAKSGVTLDDLDLGRLQDTLRAGGVRLDLAPYTNYLRARRSLHAPVFQASPHFAQCHASTLALLPNGNLVCCWFGGTREKAPDVAIWGAIYEEGRWSDPFEIARHPGIPTWNPVLFLPDSERLFASGGAQPAEADAQPPLLLYYRVGETIPTWRSLVMESRDGGRTWSHPKPLPEGCLGPIKNKPIRLADGAWLAGSSVETADEWYGVIERSEDGGAGWTRSAKLSFPGHPKGLIQPTLWESRPGHVHALLRSRGIGRIVRSDSTDGGRTWCTPYATELPNNNSGLDLCKLHVAPDDPEAGAEFAPLALVHNPVETGRTPLVVSLSFDNGRTWPHQLTLEDGEGEYSYPAVIPTADGIALCYTQRRERIVYGRFSLEQLKGEKPAGGHAAEDSFPQELLRN